MIALAFSGILPNLSFSNFTVSAFQFVPIQRLIRFIKATDLYNPISHSKNRCLPKLALVITSSSQRRTCNPACPNAIKLSLISIKAVSTLEPVPPAPIRFTEIGFVNYQQIIVRKMDCCFCCIHHNRFLRVLLFFFKTSFGKGLSVLIRSFQRFTMFVFVKFSHNEWLK